MNLLGVDVGTTYCKAGVFNGNGTALRIVRRPMLLRRSDQGYLYYDPNELWETVAAAMRDAISGIAPASIAAVGIASMAETGLLLDRQTGAARSPFIPWFDTCSMRQAEAISREVDPFERFCRTGIYPSFKNGLAKLVWLRQHDQMAMQSAVWLSSADYIVYRLTGKLATDYTLAARTYAFRIDQKTWDDEWIRQLGFEPDLFPPASPSGVPVGAVVSGETDRIGLAQGTPVAIAGHDHVCAALAAGVIKPGLVFDSIGTAETLLGALEAGPLGATEFRSGLAYGCHVVEGRHFWMGGISASGGSIEWLRSQLGEQPLPYKELQCLLDEADSKPTGILYFPYLLGSGSPHSDAAAKAALIGLRASHTRADLLRAVLEGTAYEMEFIRRAVEQATGSTIKTVRAVGGGTKNRHWMQIKADVSGCRFEVPPVPEATCLGAAMVAGLGCGVYRDVEEAVASVRQEAAERFVPDGDRHQTYRHLYEQGYLPLQQLLRQYSQHVDERR